jgi:uncharacterized membrane protein
VRIPEQSFVLQTQRHTGPLPLPEILEGYKKTDTSFPERIMKMAEAHNAADVSAKNRLSLANLVVPIAGQIFTMLLGAGGIAACVYLTQAGSSTAAIAAVAASFSPIIINAFRTLRRGGK